MNQFSLTPVLVVIACGLGAFTWYDHDSLCASGTPSLSSNVQGYINEKISKMAANTQDKIKNANSLKEAMERIANIDRNTYAALAHLKGLDDLNKLLPEEAFDFDDIPILEGERRAKSGELLDTVVARVRRSCREGK